MSSKFKKELISGTLYTGIAKYMSIAISLIVTAVLSRILTPEDFGTIAIATVLIGLITLLTGSGMSPAIIQDRKLSETDLIHIFSFTFYLSFIGGILFLVCAPFLAAIYNDRQLLYICSILSICVCFSILNIVPNALLFKNKKFKYIAIRTIIVQTILGIASICCALSGMGIYSLLVNPIVGSILLFLISYRCYPIEIRLKFNFSPINRLLPYSFYQIGFNVINYTYRNIDKLLIGKYMGFSSLGYYEKSYRLMMLPLENISNIINPVLHPLLCEYQDNFEFIFEKYKKIIQYFAYIGFSLSVVCFFSAKEIVLILFGTQWQYSINIFRILSLSIGIQLIQSAVGAVFQSTGNVKRMFYSGVIAFIMTLGAIIIGVASMNCNSLAYYLVGAFYISFIVYHWELIVVIMKKPFISFLTILIRPIFVSIIMGSSIFIISHIIIFESNVMSLIIKTLIGLLIFVFLQQVHFIKDFPSIINIIRNVFYCKKSTD